MDVVELHERTVSGFVEQVDRADGAGWGLGTTCLHLTLLKGHARETRPGLRD